MKAKNYSDIIREVYDNETEYQWKYYDWLDTKILGNPFDNPKYFITNLFNAAGKGDFLSDIKLSDERYAHMVNAYFLGIYLQNELEIFAPLKDNDGFYWFWYVCCLFHDMFFDFEKQLNIPAEDFKYNYFKSTKDYIYKDETIKNYQKYREKEMQSFDHGLIAAERIGKKYSHWLRKADRNPGLVPPKLRINEITKEKANYLARIIACHNIYVSDNEEKDKIYKDYFLEELLSTRDCKRKPVGKDFYDLLFLLLCLVDTVEPIKKRINPKMIKIRTSKCYFEIKLKTNSSIGDISSYYKSIMSMGNWLNFISVSQSTDCDMCSFKINFND